MDQAGKVILPSTTSLSAIASLMSQGTALRMKYVCFGSVILFEKMSLVYKIIKGLIFRYDFLGLNFYNKLQVIPFHVSFLIQGHQVGSLVEALILT